MREKTKRNTTHIRIRKKTGRLIDKIAKRYGLAKVELLDIAVGRLAKAAIK